MRNLVNRVLGYFGYTLKSSSDVHRNRNGVWDYSKSMASKLKRDERGKWIYPQPPSDGGGCCGGSCACKSNG